MHQQNRGSSTTVREAGRQGGLAILRARGRDHFVSIGKLGQAAMRAKHPNMASKWGKKGGRPKKRALNPAGEARQNHEKGG
jgi:general stress protein YciG